MSSLSESYASIEKGKSCTSEEVRSFGPKVGFVYGRSRLYMGDDMGGRWNERQLPNLCVYDEKACLVTCNLIGSRSRPKKVPQEAVHALQEEGKTLKHSLLRHSNRCLL